MDFILLINVAIAVASYFASLKLIPSFSSNFVSANLFGRDLNKNSDKKVPEALGVIIGASFLVSMFFFTPFSFMYINTTGEKHLNFDHREFIQYLSALLSICCMVFLGFADDVLNLKWRHKLTLPTVASLPLLLVYYINTGNTTVIVPRILVGLFGKDIDLGFFYYVYMGMLAVFCTNAINILAGVNGLEVGQSIIICLSIIIHNILELSGPTASYHKFSLYFMLPFLGSSMALLKFNWYPSKVFVGDTFCYFAGMTFAVVGILGHFSKTMLLFFAPQIINFLFSLPQLFRLVPCPRHRLPKFNPETGLLDISSARFKQTDLGKFGFVVLKFLKTLRLVHLKCNLGEDGEYMECNNMTLINLVLLKLGPLHEERLTIILIIFQIFCSLTALFIRYYISSLFFDSSLVV